MSTKFYIKDDNGTFLSSDGKTRFSSKAIRGRQGGLMLRSMMTETELGSRLLRNGESASERKETIRSIWISKRQLLISNSSPTTFS